MASSRRGSPRHCSLRIGERVVLIVAAGTSRMDNKKVKALFGGKPKMLGLEEVAEITGHEVGGVCPFGLKTPLPVYCDVSLKAFDIVVPAAGSTHSAVQHRASADGGTDRGRMGRRLRASGPRRKRRPIRLPHSTVSAGLHRLRLHLLRRAATWRCLLRSALRRRTIGLLLFGARFEHRAATLESCGVFCRKHATIRLTSGI